MYVQIYIIGGGIQPGRIKHSWFYFGFECIVNWRGESVIVGVGGAGHSPSPSAQLNLQRDIFLFNCTTCEMVRKRQV